MYLGIDYWTTNIWVAISQIGIALPYGVFEHEDFFETLGRRMGSTAVLGQGPQREESQR